MRAYDTPFREMADFEDMEASLSGKGGHISISGCTESQKIHMIYGLTKNYRCRVIVTYSDIRSREIYEDMKLYDREAVIFPARDLIFFQADIHGNLLEKERMRVLKRLLSGEDVTIITTFDALMCLQVPIEAIKKGVITIMEGEQLVPEELAKSLVDAGYERLSQAQDPGQFAIRGGIIDIYDLTADNPVRIELWGDEVDSIRIFDAESQRSLEKTDSIVIYPATELVLTEKELSEGLEAIKADGSRAEESLRSAFLTKEAHNIKTQIRELVENAGISRTMVNLESYLAYFYQEKSYLTDFFHEKDSVFILDEPMRIGEHARAVELEYRDSMEARVEKGYAIPGQMEIVRGYEETAAALLKRRLVAFYTILQKNDEFPIKNSYTVTGQSVAPYNSSFETLVKDLTGYKKQGYRVLLFTGSRTRGERLAQDLRDHNLSAFFSEDEKRELIPGEIMVCHGYIRRGFVYPLLKYVFLSEGDIFGGDKKKKKRRKKTSADGIRIKDFADLSVGDYVIHENHGLGIYKGIEKIEMEGITKDYMKVEYRDGGNLYVLASSFDSIQKYSSKDARKPKLNKLGSIEWTRTREKVRGAVNEMAADLVALYAARQNGKGFAFDADTVWQREFEETFPFEETQDQLDAIWDTKRDMESSRIMDRLICGDVGYGKTEIAIRAAFKAAQSGKQTALLVPTTILAQQHYNTFVQRMKDFPVNIGLLSRFRTPAQQKETIKGLKTGMVDIVIGTHRLLSKDVEFKDLGLLVVDEEQRFGVSHKEKIKKLRQDVDVLTLSATPIPRTLHMSLSGIRDMSILEEAPEERNPIQTFVCEYNEELVREAIVRELGRGGQVYYVYNRVNDIADRASIIQSLVPEAHVSYAHGQMQERELEQIMYDFIDGSIDVLVATTIIETGLDIPNVNTMIIHDSDNMGLSQLYQLRGRVGRSSRTAYAFLMYKKDRMLREVAEKRLAAIREFTDLGSGFRIAMRDLEIRGAGNILGKTQHGHMEAVGYELYCRMLSDAVKKEQGIEIKEETSTTVDLDVDAYIPDRYIMNEGQKLDAYKRIAAIEGDEEYADMRDELKDRYGEIPQEAENLLRIALIRRNAGDVYLSDIKGKGGRLVFTFTPDAGIRAENIPVLLERYKKKLVFRPAGVPSLEMRYEKTGIPDRDSQMLLGMVEGILRSMKEMLL